LNKEIVSPDRVWNPVRAILYILGPGYFGKAEGKSFRGLVISVYKRDVETVKSFGYLVEPGYL
jgi:hypothetical protein